MMMSDEHSQQTLDDESTNNQGDTEIETSDHPLVEADVVDIPKTSDEIHSQLSSTRTSLHESKQNLTEKDLIFFANEDAQYPKKALSDENIPIRSTDEEDIENINKPTNEAKAHGTVETPLSRSEKLKYIKNLAYLRQSCRRRKIKFDESDNADQLQLFIEEFKHENNLDLFIESCGRLLALVYTGLDRAAVYFDRPSQFKEHMSGQKPQYIDLFIELFEMYHDSIGEMHPLLLITIGVAGQYQNYQAKSAIAASIREQTRNTEMFAKASVPNDVLLKKLRKARQARKDVQEKENTFAEESKNFQIDL